MQDIDQLDIEKLIVNNYESPSNLQVLTSKRKQVLYVLLTASKAMSAYEIVKQYNHQFAANIKAMSVYRILDFLQKNKYIHKISSSNKYMVCKDTNCHKQHHLPLIIICNICQEAKEIPIQNSFLSALQQQARGERFHLQTTQLELSGICAACL